MRTAHVIAFAALVAVESLLFLEVTNHHYAWSYPRWSDQTQYLGQAYGGYEAARAGGYLAGIWSMLTPDSAQGCLHGILALPVFAIAGPSRTAALSVNLLAFICWQIATFLAVRRISGSYSIAWSSAGLLLALHFPWSAGAGSTVDFRLDWMAACAYGITLALAILADGFRTTGRAALLGVAVGTTILLRFLTVVYFGIIFPVLLVWLLTRGDRLARCGRLLLSALVALCIFAPEFWRNRATIYNYYWVGHFVGPERALRETPLGIIGSGRWVLTELFADQVGLAALGLAAGSAAAFFILAALSRRQPGPERTPYLVGEGAWIPAIVFLLVPAVVLAVHPIRPQPPVSILIPGAVWVIFLVWMRLARTLGGRAASAVAAAVVLMGFMDYAYAETRGPYLDQTGTDFRAINGLSDYIFFRAEEAGLANPRLAVTWTLNGIDADSFRVLGYERHRRMQRFLATLPTGLFRVPTRDIIQALSESDFVCLATRAVVQWPYDGEMRELLPQMSEWCKTHMTYVGRVDTADFSLSVYERPGLGAPRDATGITLASAVGAASQGPAYEEAGCPAAPVFVSPDHAIASTRAEFRYSFVAAYSPLTYRAAGLPEGMDFDSTTGEIRGRFPRAGEMTATVSASNTSGTTTGRLEVHVEDAAWFAFMKGPASCRAGEPCDIQFGEFDADRTLDFIDVTDLTTRKTLVRLEASDAQRQSWLGSHRLTLSEPGPHYVLMRFVRYDPKAREPYSFVDRQCEVDVAP